MLKREAYAYFGVNQHNERNSWSGRNEVRKKVAVTVYPYYFDLSGDYPMYHFKPHTSDARRLGRKWLVEDLKYAQDHCGGFLHVVWTEAVNPNHSVWMSDSAKTKPHSRMILKLESFNETTGEWKARVIWTSTVIPHDNEETLEYVQRASRNASLAVN